MPERKRQRVFTIQVNDTLVPGLQSVYQFQAEWYNRAAKIKSILWNLVAIQNVVAPVIPLVNITDLYYQLSVGAAGVIIGEVVNFTAVGAGSTANLSGANFMLWEPNKQYIFDSFFVNNLLPFTYTVRNDSLLQTWLVYSQFVIETEDTTIYQFGK